MKSFHFNTDCSIMRDDPIGLIMKIHTLGQNRNNLRILKYCFLFMFFLIETLLTIPGIYLIMNNINFITFTEYFTPYSFLQPGCASFIIMGNYLLNIEKITSGMYNISKVLEMQSPTFELKISKKARKCNIISILIPILSACIHLLCLPTLIDDGFGTLLFYTAKRFFGDGPNWFCICVTILFLSLDGLILMIPMLFIIYFTFHVQFQLMWLNEYVEQNLHMKNIREQEIVHLHLLNVVKYHLCFKAAFYTIYEIKKFTIILLSFAGGIAAIMCIYNIKSDTHQSRSFRIYLVMAILISNTVIICLCGQAISDESMKLRDKLYDTPWYYWNIKNRRILLMIITNIRDPWEYSFYNLIIINHQLFTNFYARVEKGSTMRGDPVRLIYRIITINQEKYNLKAIQYISLIICILLELFVLPGILSFCKNINFRIFMEYFTTICFLQPACAGLLLILNFAIKLEKTMSNLSDISKCLEMQSPDFEAKILKEARKHNIIPIIVLIFNISSHIICMPFLIDDGFGDLLYYTAKRFYGNIPDSINLFLLFFSLIAGSFAATVPLLFVSYFTFHINFQLMWLSAYIKKNLHKNFNLYTRNVVSQELIHEHLINIVKYRLCFQKAFEMMNLFQNNSIFLMGSSGLVVGVLCVYNLRNNTIQGTSIKIYLALLSAALIMWFMSFFCQSIVDKSGEIRDMLYDCPWMYWNTKNRKVLLLMITNTKNPWKISFHKLFFVDHKAITKAAKLIYSFSAVVSKFK